MFSKVNKIFLVKIIGNNMYRQASIRTWVILLAMNIIYFRASIKKLARIYLTNMVKKTNRIIDMLRIFFE